MPVDLAHQEALQKSLDVAAALATQFDASLTYVGVAADLPAPGARTPEAFRAALAAFAEAEGARHGRPTEAHAVTSNDPASDIDRLILASVEATGADLIVMATHVPTAMDRIWPSHGGDVARRAGVSVMLVR